MVYYGYGLDGLHGDHGKLSFRNAQFNCSMIVNIETVMYLWSYFNYKLTDNSDATV